MKKLLCFLGFGQKSDEKSRRERRAEFLEKILLGYGPLQVEAAFDGAKSVTCLEPAAEPAIENGKAAFYEAVRHPVDSDPLDRVVSSEDQVTIIISDITRFWSRQDLICRELVAFLHQECNMPYENMAVLVALGTHQGPERGGAAQDRVGRGLSEGENCLPRLRGGAFLSGDTSFGTPVWVNPLAVGRKVITIGATVHHLMSGYGGGRTRVSCPALVGSGPSCIKIVSAVIVAAALSVPAFKRMLIRRKIKRRGFAMLCIRDLTKVFAPGTPNEHTALDHLDLSLAPGEFVTIIGSNGAGKSTLFSAIGGAFWRTAALSSWMERILPTSRSIGGPPRLGACFRTR